MGHRIELDSVVIANGVPCAIRGVGSGGMVRSNQAEMWLEHGFVYVRAYTDGKLRMYHPANLELYPREVVAKEVEAGSPPALQRSKDKKPQESASQ